MGTSYTQPSVQADTRQQFQERLDKAASHLVKKLGVADPDTYRITRSLIGRIAEAAAFHPEYFMDGVA